MKFRQKVLVVLRKIASDTRVREELRHISLGDHQSEAVLAVGLLGQFERPFERGLSEILCTGGGLHIRPARPVLSVRQT